MDGHALASMRNITKPLLDNYIKHFSILILCCSFETTAEMITAWYVFCSDFTIYPLPLYYGRTHQKYV